mmetsp:Transcript_63667/g.186249  ORF Transcript_63667/g.186249 Transcript_63667/m.186249 type:complete len:279 (+) Transcript_63667:38-874(+)
MTSGRSVQLRGMSANERVGPLLLFVLASGLFLALIGVASTSIRVRCKAGCLDLEEKQQAALEDCLAKCQTETKNIFGGPGCSQECADSRPPKLDWDRIKVAYDACQYNCPPHEWIVQLLFQGGSAAILVVLGSVLTRCCCTWGGFLGIFNLDLESLGPTSSSRQVGPRPSQPGCVCVRLYALAFYALALVLWYLVTFRDMNDEVGVKVVCILAAVLSLGCKGLDEMRLSLLQFEIPYSELAQLAGSRLEPQGRGGPAPASDEDGQPEPAGIGKPEGFG